MPQKVYNQIQYLCQQIAKVEWSGILFYKTEGSIQDPSSFKIILEDILPLHKGTSTYTEYTFDERVIDYMEMEGNEHLEECRIGHIHSHNTMGVFFSGTDWSELEDNAPNHNYYLSLIVNNFMDFCAKVCFIAEAKNETFNFEAKDEQGKRYTVSSGNYSVPPRLIVYDCDIDSPKKNIEVNQTFTQKVRSIIEKAEKIMSNTTNNTSNSTLVKPGENWSKTQENKDFNWLFKKKLEEITPSDLLNAYSEDWCIFALNTGNYTEGVDSLEKLYEMYKQEGVTGNMLAKKVGDTFTTSYQKYLADFKEEEIKNPETFMEALTEAIFEINYYIFEATGSKEDVKQFYKPSLNMLKSIQEKFINIEV